jgi:ABC-2 type transport system permease protein
MGNFFSLVQVEYLKAIRSGMPFWTTLASLFMPLAMAFLIFISRNPEISKKLGVVSVKANLIAYSSTDLTTYLGLFGQVLATGGFFFFVMAIAWIFGREFSDGTVKDLLAVPVPRSSILGAKFVVAFVWTVSLALIIIAAGLVTAVVMQLPGFSTATLRNGLPHLGITTALVIAVIFPFGFFASIGRGYLLPLGVAILLVMSANLFIVMGLGEIFPWAIPGLYAQGETVLPPLSYLIVALTGLAGIVATYWWWKKADQNR